MKFGCRWSYEIKREEIGARRAKELGIKGDKELGARGEQ